MIDPDTHLPVDLEIRKMANGPMIGIDGSYLDQDVGPVYNPYERRSIVVVPDNETKDNLHSSKETKWIRT